MPMSRSLRSLKRPLTVLALAATGLAAVQSFAVAQSSRPRANDAYKPADQGPGLGVLNGDGTAATAPAYGSGAPAYQSPPSYVGAPPAYSTPSAPPTYSAAPPYGAPAPSYVGSPPPYAPPYAGSQYRSAAGAPSPSAPAYGAPSSGTPSYGTPAQYSGQPSGYGGQPSNDDAYRPPAGGGSSGYGEPYTPPSDVQRPAYRSDAPPPYRSRDHRPDSTYSPDEIKGAGHSLFGSISQGLANAIEHTFSRSGRPNGYILGEEGGGAFIAGVRYGQGTLFTKDAGSFPIYWQGPSVGFDAGAAGSKTMILVYNLRDTREIYDRFGGIDGSAYVVGGVGVTFVGKDHIKMAPIRSGVGLRLGANVGYLKFSHKPTWNPF